MSPILRSRRTSPRLMVANALGSNRISKYIPIDFRRAPTIRKPTKSIPEPIPLNIAQPIPHAIPQSEPQSNHYMLPSIFPLASKRGSFLTWTLCPTLCPG